MCCQKELRKLEKRELDSIIDILNNVAERINRSWLLEPKALKSIKLIDIFKNGAEYIIKVYNSLKRHYEKFVINFSYNSLGTFNPPTTPFINGY